MANFKEILAKSALVLVDFSAEWCGPCQTLAPILKSVKDQLGDTLSIIKIDIDKNQSFARSFSVQGVPTLILYKNGTQVWRQSGLLTQAQLLGVIKQYS